MSQPKNMKAQKGASVFAPPSLTPSAREFELVSAKQLEEMCRDILRLYDRDPAAFRLATIDDYWQRYLLEQARDGPPVRGKRPKVTKQHRARLIAEWLDRSKGTSWDEFCVGVAAAGWGPWTTPDADESGGGSAVAKSLSDALKIYRGEKKPPWADKGWEEPARVNFCIIVESYRKSKRTDRE